MNPILNLLNFFSIQAILSNLYLSSSSEMMNEFDWQTKQIKSLQYFGDFITDIHLLHLVIYNAINTQWGMQQLKSIFKDFPLAIISTHKIKKC